jgi:hypothetical protein
VRINLPTNDLTIVNNLCSCPRQQNAVLTAERAMVVDVNFWQRAENNFRKSVWNDSWCFQGAGYSHCCQQNNGIHHHDLLEFVEVSMQQAPVGSSFNLQRPPCVHQLAAALSSTTQRLRVLYRQQFQC